MAVLRHLECGSQSISCRGAAAVELSVQPQIGITFDDPLLRGIPIWCRGEVNPPLFEHGEGLECSLLVMLLSAKTRTI